MGKADGFVPAGFSIVSVSAERGPRVEVRNGNVYLYDEDGVLYLCGRQVIEPSGHDWVEPVTNASFYGKDVERSEFYPQAALLEDRLSEEEWLGLAHLGDERVLSVQSNEQVCGSCNMVTRKHSGACMHCEASL